DVLLEHFADAAGGFFFTADDHERLIHRPKPFADESVPAGNAVAALTLQGLGHLLGEERYLQAAESTLRAGMHALERYPDAHSTLLGVLATELDPPQVIVVRGPATALSAWQRALDRAYLPQRLALCIPDDAGALPGLLAERAPAAAPVAYVCEGTQCRLPLDGLAELERIVAA